jgi:putative tricarboxylic transport membrane protein
MNLAKKNCYSAAFWLVLSLYVVFEACQMGLGTWRMPGPGFLPFGAGILLAGISISVMVKGLQAGRGKGPSKTPGDEEPLKYRNLVLTLFGLLSYAIVLEPLGFVPATFLQLAFFVWVIGRRSLLTSIVTSLCITIGSYFLFQVALDAQFPMGILERIF